MSKVLNNFTKQKEVITIIWVKTLMKMMMMNSKKCKMVIHLIKTKNLKEMSLKLVKITNLKTLSIPNNIYKYFIF